MFILVRVIGVIIVAIGSVVLVRPEAMRRMISFWEEGKRIYAAGVLRLLFGVICLSAASQCRLSGVVTAFGIMFLLGGIIIFVLGLDRIKSICKRWSEKSNLVIRLLGFLSIAIGALLLYAV